MNIDDIIENARLKGRVIALQAEVERLRSSSFVTAVPSEDYEKLKAELDKVEEHNEALCERAQDLAAELHTASCYNANLHKENSALKAAIESHERVDCLAVERLKAEVERLRKAGDGVLNSLDLCYMGKKLHLLPSVIAWNAAKEGKQS